MEDEEKRRLLLLAYIEYVKTILPALADYEANVKKAHIELEKKIKRIWASK